MSNDNKIENMKKAIIKSGFPLEIFTASISCITLILPMLSQT